jgi:DNA modification methylase
VIRDRIKELKRVKASDLRPHPSNWRTHPASQRDALSGILAEVGYAGALLAREADDGALVLIDGHLRADTTPDQDVPVLVLDVTEAEADKLLAVIDPIAAMAGADTDKLSKLLDTVNADDQRLREMLDELKRDHGLLPAAEIVEDEVPELPKTPVTKAGDLWRLGEHRLLCGDSTKGEDVAKVLENEHINISVTSPPYAKQREYDKSSGFKPIPPTDYVSWFAGVQALIRERLAPDGSFFLNIKPAADGLDTELYVFDLVIAFVREWGWHFATEFCWERTGVPKGVTRRFKNQFEPIYQFAIGNWKMRPEAVRHASSDVPVSLGKGSGNTGRATRQGKSAGAIPSNRKPRRAGKTSTKSLPEMQGTGCDVGEYVVNGFAFPGNRLPPFTGSHEATGHAAAFPVGLPAFFISAYTDEGDIVYEPFCGSGSTIIAAEQLNRRCMAIEIAPAYCDVCIERWEKLTGGKAHRGGDK